MKSSILGQSGSRSSFRDFMTKYCKGLPSYNEKPPALKGEHPALQNMILTFFLLSGPFFSPRFVSAFPMQIRIQPSKSSVDLTHPGSIYVYL
jgi:hypothetical protein